MSCHCSIIPEKVLQRLAADPSLSDAERKSLVDTSRVDAEMRALRTQAGRLTTVTRSLNNLAPVIAQTPTVTVADCKHSQNLPGLPVANPSASNDATAKRAFDETTEVARFFQTVFGRNSIDDAGMTLGSSIHYGHDYNNAFWNGLRMTYGDGNGQIFLDFTLSTDVIAHELTHGVTQHTLQLAYTNEAGGLNESASDVFGSMFRQWRKGQTVAHADWLIGHEILGPVALAKNFTCLRDMAHPGAAHCLSPQPFLYSDYRPGMDPHESSGIPNYAFYKTAMAIGGHSWDKAGKIWCAALTSAPPTPNMKMKAFAKLTRTHAAALFPGNQTVIHAVDNGWKAVGL